MSKIITVLDPLESNKLIAKFMGIQVIGNYYEVPHRPDLHCFRNEELLYHESWDWLMPVVEKIENLEFGKWYVHIQGNIVSIEDGNDGIGLWDFHINNEDPNMSLFPTNRNLKPIEAVYIAVTEFIKWYNENKNK